MTPTHLTSTGWTETYNEGGVIEYERGDEMIRLFPNQPTWPPERFRLGASGLYEAKGGGGELLQRN